MTLAPNDMTDYQLFGSRKKAVIWLGKNDQSTLKKKYDPNKFTAGLRRYELIEDEIKKRENAKS